MYGVAVLSRSRAASATVDAILGKITQNAPGSARARQQIAKHRFASHETVFSRQKKLVKQRAPANGVRKAVAAGYRPWKRTIPKNP
jgi:hypothetical protein